jgi:hypothetical protein
MFQNGKFEIMYTNKNRRYVTHITRRNVQTNLRILLPIQQGKKEVCHLAWRIHRIICKFYHNSKGSLFTLLKQSNL